LFGRAAFLGRSFLLVISELEKTFKKRLKKHYKIVVIFKNIVIFVMSSNGARHKKIETMKAAISLINKAVDQIETMNFNGYQRNPDNYRIIKNGKNAISSNNIDCINQVLLLISKNTQGFKTYSPYDPTPKICIDAELILKELA
jgi:hypothetical protein